VGGVGGFVGGGFGVGGGPVNKNKTKNHFKFLLSL
jgi:hypothetical protein